MKQLNEFEKQMLIYRIDNLKNLSNKDFMVSFAGIVNDFDLLQKEDIENLQNHDWCRDNIRHEYTIIKPLSKNVSNALVEEKKDNTGRQRYYDNVFYIKGKNVLLSSEWYDGTGRKPDNKTIFVNWLRDLVNGNPKGNVQSSNNVSNYPCQQIFYGAPGTGKSHEIKELTKGKSVVRTTFHPDSDYSTFVGAYKPTMSNPNSTQRLNLSVEDLAQKLGTYYNDSKLGKIGGVQKFCLDYYPYIDGEYMSVNVSKLLELAGISDNYAVEINKYLKFCRLLPQKEDNKIVYNFTPQAFTNAYVEAWNTEEEVYLVIEEINRGNCAQIFGDLFQLLDRKNGVSEYPVEADTDLQGYLNKALANTSRTDIPDDVKSGKKLMLPSNLYIWATMNTSDQSLFPIDSAFKRRWEWKYIKIKEGKDENGNKLDWKVDVKINDTGELFSWWAFIQKINEIIASMTSSADKQLGYFFCCAKDGVIDEETFVSKVIFYLWNDVFKDYGFEDASLFRYITKDEAGKETEKDLTFPDFYDEEGEKVNTERLTDFVKKVMNWKADEKKDYD